MLLGQVDMEKRFMDLDGLEQQERLNEDMESGLELEYARGAERGSKAGNGCPCAKGSDTVIFLSRNFRCADDGDTQVV